jgi:hypothetical protein
MDAKTKGCPYSLCYVPPELSGGLFDFLINRLDKYADGQERQTQNRYRHDE